MRYSIYFAICMLFIASSLVADEARVINNSKYDPIFVGLYKVKANVIEQSLGPAELISGPIEVPMEPTDVISKLSRPPRAFRYNRELIFSPNEDDLLPEFSKEEYLRTSRTPAGWWHGATFHIGQKNGSLRGYTDIEWKFIEPFKTVKREIEERMLEELRKSYLGYPYGRIQAKVRQGTALAPEEITVINNRFPKVKDTLERIIGRQLLDHEVPRIGIAMSGGGMRAAICTYGFFAGLNDIGLLDSTLYAAGLSGSTWLLSHYLMSGLPIDEYKEPFMKALTERHLISPSAVADVLWPKFIFGQHISIVDIYGVFLANTWFRNLHTDLARQRLYFTDLRRRIATGDKVFPICTAVEASSGSLGYSWFSFTPYEVGSERNKLFTPTWSFGRRFKNGKSIDFAPEQTLGFLMGLWGSALSGTAYHMLKAVELESHPTLMKALDNIMMETGVGGLQFAAIKMLNPWFGVEGPYKNLTHLTLFDSGYAFNVPLPPLFNKERNLDIIICLDASGDVHQGEGAADLRKAENYFRQTGQTFPPIDYTDIISRPVSVFENKNDPTCPTLIYVVPVKNPNYKATSKNGDPAKLFSTTYSTSKFTYKRDDVEWLSGLVQFNMDDNKEEIYEAIKKKVEQKQRLTKPKPKMRRPSTAHAR